LVFTTKIKTEILPPMNNFMSFAASRLMTYEFPCPGILMVEDEAVLCRARVGFWKLLT
jgi:hypothetical protein